nr:hypothetical protein [uncultured Cupriavidus sp.]
MNVLQSPSEIAANFDGSTGAIVDDAQPASTNALTTHASAGRNFMATM